MNKTQRTTHPSTKKPWGHERVGRLSLESDGSIVMLNQVVGQIAPDYFAPEETKDISFEIVRRWNAFED